MAELLVGMIVVSILAGLSISGWTRYQRNLEHRGTALELVSALRNAQQRSLTEAKTYCVSFDPATRSYRTYKFACGATGTALGEAKKTRSQRVLLQTPAFLQTDGSSGTTLSFFPRGSATKGTVRVGRTGGSKTYSISVEGLTGRVSFTG